MELGNRGDFAESVAHIGDIGQSHRMPRRQPHFDLRQVIGRARIAQHAHGLARSGDFSAATRRIQIYLPQNLVDLGCSDALRNHPRRIERDRDFTINPARTLDFGHARDRQQPLCHSVVDIPRQLFHRHVIGRNREIGDRLRRSLGLEHLGFKNAFRQFTTHAVHRVLHFIDRGIDILPDLELDLGRALPFAGGRRDRVHARDRTHAGFDFLGDLVADFGRRSARLRDRHDHQRKFDIGSILHFHRHERENANDRQPQKEHDRHDRIADRPRRQIAKIHARILSPPPIVRRPLTWPLRPCPPICCGRSPA